MHRLLFFTHTDWRWIRQRPQFLSEKLGRHCDVDVVFKKSFRAHGLVARAIPARARGLRLAPFSSRRFRLISTFDRFIHRRTLSAITRAADYDALVVTHPLLFAYICHLGVPIYFDCQDDNAAFYPKGSWIRREIERSQERLIREAQGVVFSSLALQQRHGSLARRSMVVRNGHDLRSTARCPRPSAASATRKLFYFGTISKWFDFAPLLASLARYDALEYHLIGPSDTPIPRHDRLIAHGPLPHAAMVTKSFGADGFVMPFKVTPLIECVDPVKLYEYLTFCRPVIAPRYPELSHFERFVHLYDTESDYLSLMDRFIAGSLPVKGAESLPSFLDRSTWDARASEFHNFVFRST